MNYNMYLPTRTLFGAGTLNELKEQKLPGKKALLLISDSKSTRANGYLSRTEEQLKSAKVEYVIFDKINANPTKAVVEEGGTFAKENGCDFIVALGGGSVMDAAKAIAMLATNEGDLWDFVGGKTGKNLPLPKEPLPIVAITTTAGTGSEVDAWGVITNEQTNEKIGVGGLDSLFPVLAIVDPELMVSVPPNFTAYQGFDALFHSTEVYISRASNLFSDMVALTAIENIGKYLARAVQNGKDTEAREHVAFANTMSGYAMVAGSCTSEHSLEHAMSAYHPALPHGAGLIMISRAYYTHFVQTGCRGEQFVRMAKALGKEDAREPMDFVTALFDLQKACGVDELKMSDYGIRADEFATLAQNAKEAMGGLFEVDPVPLSQEDCVKIYQESYR